MEKRAEQAEEKEKQLKLFKRCVKNASCLQCQNCSKFFVSSIFVPHLNVCVVGPELGKTQKQEAGLTIQIKQTLVKESDSKPYTEYVIEVTRAQSNDMWTINRKYK